MSALEPEVLNKQRLVKQPNIGGDVAQPEERKGDERELDDAVALTIRDEKILDNKLPQAESIVINDQNEDRVPEPEERKAMIVIGNDGKEYDDADVMAGRRHNEAPEESDSNQPLDAVDPAVINSKMPSDSPRQSKILLDQPNNEAPELYTPEVLTLPIRDEGVAHVDESNDDPLDAVEGKVLLGKIPEDSPEAKKARTIKNQRRDDAMLEKRRTAIEKSRTVNKREDEAMIEKQDIVQKVSKVEDNKVIASPAVPVLIKGQTLEEDPLNHVDPNVLDKSISDAEAQKEPKVNEERKASEESEDEDDPMDAVEGKVFDKSPDNKRTPIEILAGLGYDASKHQLDDVIVIDLPVSSVEQLGNTRLNQNDFNMHNAD